MADQITVILSPEQVLDLCEVIADCDYLDDEKEARCFAVAEKLKALFIEHGAAKVVLTALAANPSLNLAETQKLFSRPPSGWLMGNPAYSTLDALESLGMVEGFYCRETAVTKWRIKDGK